MTDVQTASRRNGEAETFHLWVFSDAHVATDKAVSDAIRNGMAFTPPAGYPGLRRGSPALPYATLAISAGDRI